MMPWPRVGESSEDFAKRRKDHRREQRQMTVIAVVLLAVLVAILLAAKVIHAELVYDDWRCAFAECRILKGGR